MRQFNPLETTRVIVRKARKRVVRNWRSRINDYSTRALAACTVLPIAWQHVPQDWKDVVPPEILLNAIYCISAIAFTGLVGKFVTQPTDGE